MRVTEDDAEVEIVVVDVVVLEIEFEETVVAVVIVPTGEAAVESPEAGWCGSHDDAIVPLNCDDTVERESRYDTNEVGSAPSVTVSLSG